MKVEVFENEHNYPQLMIIPENDAEKRNIEDVHERLFRNSDWLTEHTVELRVDSVLEIILNAISMETKTLEVDKL